MRLLATSLLLTALGVASLGHAEPRRVMSLSMCTDDLLLELLPKERIASLSYYARQPTALEVWPQAASIPVNFGTAEEILAAKPDLVLTGTYTTPATRRILKSLHFALLEVPPANDFEEIRQVTRLVAHTLERDARGAELIERMDMTLLRLHESLPRRSIRVAAWGEGGSIPGQGTLFDAILRAAGGTNIAIANDQSAYTSFDLEQLLQANPDIIAYSSTTTDTPGLNTDLALHPLVIAHFAHRRITYPSALYACGVTASANAAVSLRASLLQALDAP
jgi:iron complex transport system substrate-binding protein